MAAFILPEALAVEQAQLAIDSPQELVKEDLARRIALSCVVAVVFGVLTVPNLFPTSLVLALVVTLTYTSFSWALSLINLMLAPGCLQFLNRLSLWSGLWVFLFLQILHWTLDCISLTLTTLPLLFGVLLQGVALRLLTEEPLAFFRVMDYLLYFVLTLTAVLSGLKWDGFLSLSWFSCFLPILIALTVASTFAFAALFMFLFAIVQRCSSNNTWSELLTTLWFFVVTAGSVASYGFFFSSLARAPETLSSISWIPMIYHTIFAILTSVLQDSLAQWWFDLLYSDEIELEAVEPRSVVLKTVNFVQAAPRKLLKLSTTYFRPLKHSTIDHVKDEPAAGKHLYRASMPVCETGSNEHADDCELCCNHRATVVVMPCGHGGLCIQCAAVLKGKACPICRCSVQGLLEIDLNSRGTYKVLRQLD